MRTRSCFPFLLMVALLAPAPLGGVRAQEAPGPAPDSAAASVPVRPEVAVLETAAQHVRALMAGSLDVAVDAATLFDVPLGDDEAIRVESERLRGVIDRADRAADPGRSDGTPADVDAELLAARIDLDRARQSFYLLPADQRQALLDQHAERQREDAAARVASAEQKARDAEEERQRALEAARAAQTEAERLVAEEYARLLGVAGQQADFEAGMARDRQALEQRAEETLGLRRRVRELAEGHGDGAPADALYDELRSFLRVSRNQLDAAISAARASSAVPEPGGARLDDLAVDVDRTEVDQAMRAVQSAVVRLRVSEAELRTARALQLYDEVRALNADRLSLLDHLSASKRGAITGLSPAGFDQAAAEVRQISLVLRYRLMVTRQWTRGLFDSSSTRSRSAIAAGGVAFRWLLVIVAFLWWHQRGGTVLTQWRTRVREEDRRARLVEPSRVYRAICFLQEIRSPLEWLLLVGALFWMLPSEADGQLEVGLLRTVFTWILGGSLAVRVIDFLAGSEQRFRRRHSAMDTAALRLRSLRLVGRTVVVFGLTLSLSAQLVGRGTIHTWVSSICWFAVVPVVFVIVRWWRRIIFARIQAVRKKRAFENWVIAHQSGWRSVLAAVAAGTFLFVTGAVRVVRSWASGFDVTRRALAWLFRRGMDRLAEEKADVTFGAVPPEVFSSLGPDVAVDGDGSVPGGADEQVKAVVARIQRVGGGVFAVVGERGAGKTTILRRVSDPQQEVVFVDCPYTGLDGLRAALASTLDADPDATLEECAAILNAASDGDGALLIDNAHRLIQPVMGGLASFDHLIQVARANSSECTWVFGVNEVIWRFFERARGARPMFDEVVSLDPWREEEIVQLLTTRSRQAGIEPSFEHLVETLPADADEVDRAEAHARAAAGYYRLLWDYSSGNPGVALHMWRHCLGTDGDGKVCVKLFQAPDSRELELLPDTAVFVLRAVVQLEPARVEDVVRATMLRTPQVEDALRYGLGREYFVRDGDRYRVTWGWFRPITRFLQRRHLLAARR